jgi:hypothetical protein
MDPPRVRPGLQSYLQPAQSIRQGMRTRKIRNPTDMFIFYLLLWFWFSGHRDRKYLLSWNIRCFKGTGTVDRLELS